MQKSKSGAQKEGDKSDVSDPLDDHKKQLRKLLHENKKIELSDLGVIINWEGAPEGEDLGEAGNRDALKDFVSTVVDKQGKKLKHDQIRLLACFLVNEDVQDFVAGNPRLLELFKEDIPYLDRKKEDRKSGILGSANLKKSLPFSERFFTPHTGNEWRSRMMYKAIENGSFKDLGKKLGENANDPEAKRVFAHVFYDFDSFIFKETDRDDFKITSILIEAWDVFKNIILELFGLDRIDKDLHEAIFEPELLKLVCDTNNELKKKDGYKPRGDEPNTAKDFYNAFTSCVIRASRASKSVDHRDYFDEFMDFRGFKTNVLKLLKPENFELLLKNEVFCTKFNNYFQKKEMHDGTKVLSFRDKNKVSFLNELIKDGSKIIKEEQKKQSQVTKLEVGKTKSTIQK